MVAAVVVPTIVVAAPEATTMAVVPVRGTKRCHAVAEAAVPVLAAAEVLTDGPATSMEVPQSEQKQKPAMAGNPSFSYLSLYLFLWPIRSGQNSADEEIQRLEVNDCFPLMWTAGIYITSTVGSTCRLQYLCLFGKDTTVRFAQRLDKSLIC
jgi:hypothetical protein